MAEPLPLLVALADPSPAAVAEALKRVRFRDLKDTEVLDAVLRACADERAVDGGAVEGRDPFTAFFSGAPNEGSTVAAVAADRLEKAGLPEDDASADRLARVLDALPTAGPLGPVAAKLLGETRWSNPDLAVRRIVPALCRHDIPLFQVLVRLPSAVTAVMCEIAATPFRPRLFQELMNHSPSQEGAVAALVASVGAGTAGLDEAGAVTVMSVLAAWNRPELTPVAAMLEAEFPLALAWRALDDEPAREALALALDGGGLDPARFWPRLAEVLRHRESLPAYPVATFLRLTGVDPGVIRALGVDDAVEGVLHAWVAALDADPDRAWTAALALIDAGRLGPSRDALEAALAVATPEAFPPFEEAALRTLAGLSPPLAGFVDLLGKGVRIDPSVLPAVAAAAATLDDASVARICGAALDVAEALPRAISRLSAKTVREAASGVDIDAIAPLVPRLHEASRERFERVRSVVRAG